MMIAKVISGGQVGVDIAALRAAARRGKTTGGTMPAGFRTLAGPRSEWARQFNLTAHKSEAYPPRTYQNVRDSDVSIRIALDFRSAGEICTAKAIAQYHVDSYDVRLERQPCGSKVACDERDITRAAQTIVRVAKFLGRGVTVNFAGNADRYIEADVETIVSDIIGAAEAMS